MPIPPPPPPPPGPPPPPTLSQVRVTSLGGEVSCPHMGPLAGIAAEEGWLWQGWDAPGGGNVELRGPREVLSCCCSSPGKHRTAEAEPRGAAGPWGSPAGHL